MEKKKSKQMRYDQWSLLPSELLHNIMEKLYYSNCINVAATCKNWNIPVPTISRSLPWMISLDWFVSTGSNGRSQLCCKLNLYEAMNPRAYPTICRSFDLPSETESFDIVGNVEVKDTKLGWELVEIPIIIIATRISKSLLVLCNPFVQDFRFLPALEIPTRVGMAATFSHPPPPPPSSSSSSSECFVYAISPGPSFLRIHSWRWCNDQQKNWEVASSYDYNIEPNIRPLYKFHSLVAMEDGTLYCLEKDVRSLVTFKNSSNSIQVQTISFERPADLVGNAIIIAAQLTEHEGGMFLVCCCHSGSYNLESFQKMFHSVFRYDKSANCWIMKQRLNYRSFYACEPYDSNSAFVIASDPSYGMLIGNGVYVWRMVGSGGVFVFPFQEKGAIVHVPMKEIFPSYQRGSCGVRVQWILMRPSLA